MEPALVVLKSLNRGVSAVEQLRRRMEADSRAAYVARHHLHCRSKFTCSLGDVATTNASMVPWTEMPARSCAAYFGVEAAGQVGSGTSGGGTQAAPARAAHIERTENAKTELCHRTTLHWSLVDAVKPGLAHNSLCISVVARLKLFPIIVPRAMWKLQLIAWLITW